MGWASSGWLPRSLLGLLLGAAAALAWREGRGTDARAVRPRPATRTGQAQRSDDARSEAGRSAASAAGGGEAYQVHLRLVEALDEARIDVPDLAAAAPYLQAYWRRLRGPWDHPQGPGRALVTTIALRTDAAQEKAWTVVTPAGQTWAPDAHVWNMNEGSFDQRQAIEAPTPATLTFRLKIPPAARLRFSSAVATPVLATTVFDVALVDSTGAAHALSHTRMAGPDTRRWADADVDLGPWAGQTVDLRLQTSTERSAALDATAASPLSLALWGSPVLVAKAPTRIPYNVLWIVVDALRPDTAAALHDAEEDARKLAAPQPPLDALLPAVPGLMPSIDRLAARGVHFSHAWSVASWTRPGTLAMLTGERSSEVGIDTTAWVLPTAQIARYYASDPPSCRASSARTGL